MIANYHTHTTRCHHAVGQDEEYVRSAVEGGLQILGFSDHTPYLFSGGYVSPARMLPEELPGYCDSVRDLGQRYADRLEIHLGVEAEYYPLFWKDTLSLLRDNGVEYMILGQHEIENEIGQIYILNPSDDRQRLCRYVRQVCEGMETGCFSYVAHPDVICFTGSKEYYREQMRTLCRTANQCGIPLEINLLGIRENRTYPTPCFWDLAAEEGCTVVLGCDAHHPTHAADLASEAIAMEIIQKLGLKYQTTVELRKI